MKRKAFTLVEVLVVVVVIGVLAAMVVPKFANAQADARVAATAEDLRLMEVAIGMYYTKTGKYPADIYYKLMPIGLAPYFKTDNPFAKPVPIGGMYDYEGTPGWSPVQISIRPDGAIAHTDADALELDEFIDDGNLSTGSLRRDGTRTYFIIE